MPGKASLSELQAAIAAAVMRPLGAGDSMRQENRATASALIKPNDRLTSFERLQIYNQQYWWRLLGSFAEDFRGLRAVLGERKFNRLAVGYLNAYGSQSWNLRDLGGQLENFITATPAAIAPFGALAIEMVRVEWARVVAFDSEPGPPLDAQRLALRPPEKMVMGIQPYISLLELTYPIDHLLRRLRRSGIDSASNAVSGGLRSRRVRLTAKPAKQPLYLAVHRLDLLVYYKRLEPEAYHLLRALRDGNPLEHACGIAFGNSPLSASAIAEKVRTWFAAWTSFGWLCGRKGNRFKG